MTSIGIGNLTRLDIVYAIENGYKHTVYRFVRQEVVRVAHTFCSPCTSDTSRTDQGSTNGHEDGCWNALSTHVGNYKANAIFINTEEVVEVATNVLSGIHGCGYIQLTGILGEWREDTRQNGLLNLLGHSQIDLD